MPAMRGRPGKPGREESVLGVAGGRMTRMVLAVLLLVITGSCGPGRGAEPAATPPPTRAPGRSFVERLSRFFDSAHEAGVEAAREGPVKPTADAAAEAATATSMAAGPSPTPVGLVRGVGSGSVAIDEPEEGAVVEISHQGRGNVVVRTYDADGAPIALLVNAIGTYRGRHPLGFGTGKATRRFELETAGRWTVQVLPPEQVWVITPPARVEGTGDDILRLSAAPGGVAIDASSTRGSFVVRAHGKTAVLVVNEIAPFSGAAAVDPDTNHLEIKADGPWVLEVTAAK